MAFVDIAAEQMGVDADMVSAMLNVASFHIRNI
jgi:hypothetical protein